MTESEHKKERKFTYDDYLSPFTWRYGSAEMRSIFSEKSKRAAWRKVWLALAEAEEEQGLLSRKELLDIGSKAGPEHVDIAAAHEVERRIRHDLMAELKVFARQARSGGGKLHLGATSTDVEDNADTLLYRRAMEIVRARLVECLAAARERILKHSGMVCMAWTHLQPAEPTTIGYRFANYAQDLVIDIKFVDDVLEKFLLGKGVKGAVGTSASYKSLLGADSSVRKLERSVMESLGLESFGVATQTYPRKSDFILLTCLASIALSCHKFGLDIRILQSPGFAEVSEPSDAFQVGSSAMPSKRNPVLAERMCSLARLVSSLPGIAFWNGANSILERTLDDSAARRVAIPEAFLAIDECLALQETLLKGLKLHKEMIRRNLGEFGPFAGTEPVLMRLVQLGGNRQRLHEKIRRKSMKAWEEVTKGHPNPLGRLLAEDRGVSSKIKRGELARLMDPTNHIGDAKERCLEFVKGTVDPILAAAGARLPTRSSEY